MHRISRIPKPPARPAHTHKGTAGLVLVVAGSRGMAGAAALVGNGALRAGAGLVRIATPDDALDTVAALAPCCTTAPLADWPAGEEAVGAENAKRVLALADGQDALAMGPGMGQSDAVARLVHDVLEGASAPLVLDADGLNVLADDARTALGRAAPPVVITPHPGEAARLLGTTAREVQADREAAAAVLADWTEVAVLKGAGTVVTDGSRLYVNETGNPGMATAGAGDVLTGMMTALVGSGMEPFDAAVLAVWAHGRAGDLAAERFGTLGLTAWDILGCVPEALRL